MTDKKSEWHHQPDPGKETRERLRTWLGQAARSALSEVPRLTKEGLREAASQLDVAAKEFRSGNKDRGIAHMDKAAREARSAGKPEEANRIEAKVEGLQIGLNNIRVDSSVEEPPEAHRIMRGE